MNWTVWESNPGRPEILCAVPDWPWDPPSLLYNWYQVIPFLGGGYSSRSVVLTTHLLLVPGCGLWMGGNHTATSPLCLHRNGMGWPLHLLVKKKKKKNCFKTSAQNCWAQNLFRKQFLCTSNFSGPSPPPPTQKKTQVPNYNPTI
jgi:hypothetical protein